MPSFRLSAVSEARLSVQKIVVGTRAQAVDTFVLQPAAEPAVVGRWVPLPLPSAPTSTSTSTPTSTASTTASTISALHRPPTTMSSPPSSPDLHPPAYLQPGTESIHEDTAAPPSVRTGTSSSSFRLPPPAVASSSSYVVPPDHRRGSIRSPLEQLENQTRRLTNELQSLLDAQSLALTNSLEQQQQQQQHQQQHEHQQHHQQEQRRQSAPASPSSPRTKAHRRRPRVDLNAARHGIFTAMSELYEVKTRESSVLSGLAQERSTLLSTITTHSTKTSRLRAELGKIDASPDAARVESLRSETASIAGEIASLRQRLAALEAAHASKRTQLSELENVLAARSASYRSALDALSRKTAEFLEERGMASPEVAGQVWAAEAEAYAERGDAAEREAEALEAGMELWDAAMRKVCLFEDALRERVQAGEVEGDALADEMREVVDGLERMVARAEKNGWNLLVAAIGAELQAFREAEEMLKRTLLREDAGERRDSGSDDAGDHAFPMVPVRATDYSPLDD